MSNYRNPEHNAPYEDPAAGVPAGDAGERHAPRDLEANVGVGAGGTVLEWDLRAEAALGWSAEHVLGQSLFQLLVPSSERDDQRLTLHQCFDAATRGGLKTAVELPVATRRSGESPARVEFVPLSATDGVVARALIQVVDKASPSARARGAPEDRFRSMADSAAVLIWLSETDGRCTWFNQRWLEFVGTPLARQVNDGWLDFVHPEDAQTCLNTYVRAFDAREAFSLEYRLRRHDGAWRWVLHNGNPLYSDSSSFLGYVGSCTDITEWRHSVDVAEENQTRYRTLAESLPHLVWTCLPDGWCDYLSRQWVEYTGISEEQQLGYGWAEQLHPQDRQRAQAAWTTATAEGDPFDIEFRIRRFDGVYRWFKTRAVPLRNSQNRIIKWFGSNTDFEEHKRAEQRLELFLERFGLLDRITRAIGARQDLRNMFDIVIASLEESLSIDFGCICLGEAGAAALTVSLIGRNSRGSAELVGLHEGAHLSVDPNGLSQCLRGQLVYEPETAEVMFPFPQKLAASGLHSLVLAPLLVESRVFGVLVAARRGHHAFSSPDCEFLRQLSEHVGLAAHQAELYQALHHAYEDLRQSREMAMQHERLRALGQMAGGIAHNINNAISPVSLYTDALLDSEPNLSARAREYLETIQRAISDVAATVAGMREFYRQRKTEVVLVHVSLNEVARHALALTRARWGDIPQRRGVTIQSKLELDPAEPTVWGLASEIREALVNLIFNAADAMPDGGTLSIRTFCGREGDGVTSRGYVEVADDGIGMDEDLRSKCVEPFVTTKGERGTGLGLAMVYGVAQRHDASIDIQSTPNRGTTVQLGFAMAPRGENAHASFPTAQPTAGQRILVIDDDVLVLKVLRHTLTTDGHDVVTADSGEAGIQAFESALGGLEPFTLVITDLGMPHVDGQKVARAVKRLAARTPVILLTGWGQRLLPQQGPDSNVDQILDKPPRLSELRETLSRLCPPAEAS